MAKFTIWARVTQDLEGRYVATASAVPLTTEATRSNHANISEVCASFAAARHACVRLAGVLSEALRVRGDTVLAEDVEVDTP